MYYICTVYTEYCGLIDYQAGWLLDAIYSIFFDYFYFWLCFAFKSDCQYKEIKIKLKLESAMNGPTQSMCVGHAAVWCDV